MLVKRKDIGVIMTWQANGRVNYFVDAWHKQDQYVDEDKDDLWFTLNWVNKIISEFFQSNVKVSFNSFMRLPKI